MSKTFKYLNDERDNGKPLTLNDIAKCASDKTWYSNIYDKINGVETIVAYASFNSTNLLSMYGNRLVKSFDLLENGDFEVHLQEEK
ncbi:MAG: hypothetical protein WCT00_06200 [Bacilli bacterium]